MKQEGFSRSVKVIGHLFFLALFILAGYYFKERTIVLDSALQIFKWVNYDGFNIEAGRVSAIIPQFIPKLLIWFGAPLKSVLFTASLSFILVFYVGFLVAIYKLKSEWAALGILLALVLCSLRTFYFSVVEVHQALVYPFLLLAWLQYKTEKRGLGFYLPAALLMLLCFLTHPTTLFTVAFVVGFYAILNEELKKPWPWALAAFALVFFLLRWTVFSVGTYESGLYAEAMDFGAMTDGFWQLPGNRFVLDQVWKLNTLYLLPTLLFMFSLIAILLKQRFLLAGFYVLSIVLFLVVNAFTFQKGDSAMMMEKNYLALGVFIAIGLVYVLKDTDKGRLALVVLVPLVLLFKFRDMSMSGAKTAKPRLEALSVVVESGRQAEGQKFVMESAAIPERISVHWALPFETLLLSALEDEKQVMVHSSEFAQEYDLYAHGDSTMVIPYLKSDGELRDLDQRYFQFAPGKYLPLMMDLDH